ncbi:MAG: hypothetical protein HY543_04220 [Deltaproteobacteria bacterium]|nr:hypothetical protein [Deltaproteobacteria bacterium]
MITIHKYLYAAFCALLCIASTSFAAPTRSSEYRYADGSGNEYVVAHTAQGTIFGYRPVRPEESSSGEYSGGHAIAKPISQQQYEMLRSLFTDAARRTAIHIRKRLLGSGVIAITTGAEVQEYILAPDSPEKRRLETALKALMLP